jgi:putative flippase GtrA
MAQVSTQFPAGVKSPTAAPIRKVAAGGLGGAVATIVLWALAQFANIHPDPTIAAAITTVISFLVAYIVPPSANDAPVPR